VLRGARIAVVVASVTGCLVLASSAPAATLLGDYQLQGTRSSSGPGSDLTDVVGPDTFQTESVMGTSRQVLAFPLGSGVRMSPVGFGSATPTYSVVTTFRLDAVDDYRKILDSSGGISDDGIYDHDGTADYFGVNEFTSGGVFSPGVYATVAILSEPPSSTKIFVNGSQVVDANETLPVTIDSLRFFVDDGTTTDENSAGAVSCIRVFSGALTASEVSAIGASPTCQPPPPPTSAKKKCKKHKKKHKRSAESAKKKKCKKKKKKG
jgi:hypothetical protein